MINAIHGSKNARIVVEHSWTTFSPDKFLIQNNNDVKKPRDPLMIKCPRCGKFGRVNEYHPRKGTRPDVTRFYVKHEYIGGYWGKVEKVKRFRRCYFSRENIIPYMAIG